MVLRLILAAIVLFLLFKVISKGIYLLRWYQQVKAKTVGGGGEPVSEMVRDPVCGVYISGDRALSAVKGGRRYYFCSQECHRKFLERQG